MSTYVHTLTDFETACGVTLDRVAEELPRGLFINNGQAFVAPNNIGPALAASVACCAFRGALVEFAGFNEAGYPVYRLA